MRELWWFIHIFGVSLWFGVTTAAVIAWPSRAALRNEASFTETSVRVRTLVTMLTRSSHLGAGLAALGGIGLSFMVHPKSELGSLWLTSMQGIGVVAFVISTFVMTRKGKRLLKQETNHRDDLVAAAGQYRGWLVSAFVLLLVCLVMAAFKFTLS